MTNMQIESRELLTIADTVAREKSIERDEVLEAMEQAIQKAGRSKYGHEHDIRAHIDRKTGVISLKRYRVVVEEIENEAAELTLAEAQAIDPNLQMGDVITEDLPPIDFGRVAAQTAKQVIYQKVRDAERAHQFEEYKDRAGEIISGIVKRIEFGNVIVELGKAEAFLRRDAMIPRENFRTGDRIRALLLDVREEARGSQLFLSRVHNDFVSKLFAQEVPEIYDGVIQIKAVARDPGSRAKIAVYASDPSIDPIGSCVGIRGSRVQAVVQELQGEKIDIVPWSSDIGRFVVSAIAPAQVAKVVLDEDKQRLDIVVPEDQLSLAIGRRGQNVRLASSLVGWGIDIMTEEEEIEKRGKEVAMRSKMFVEALDVDDVLAHLLVGEGFTKIEEIAFVDLEELMSIEGFDEALSTELQDRAKTFIETRMQELETKAATLDIADDLRSFDRLSLEAIVALAENGVKTLDDLADLAADELLEMLPESEIGEGQANDIIMAARAHWFDDEQV